MDRLSRVGAGYIGTCILGGLLGVAAAALSTDLVLVLRVVILIASLLVIGIGVFGVSLEIGLWMHVRRFESAVATQFQLLKPDAARVMAQVMIRHLDQDNDFDPSLEETARSLGMTNKTLIESVGELVRYGLVHFSDPRAVGHVAGGVRPAGPAYELWSRSRSNRDPL